MDLSAWWKNDIKNENMTKNYGNDEDSALVLSFFDTLNDNKVFV